ncbi:MAG: autotransporter [Gemmatimonadetes bacterium]|nr:autotransporter [Gemmatimonadota bacterium]
MSGLTRLANAVTVAGAARSSVRLSAALREPAAAQGAVLERILRGARHSEYGRAHRFARLRGAADFAEGVPLVEHDDLVPWIDRIAAGEANVLTRAPVRFMEPTGGSSGYMKLVPYTDALLGEFSAATLPWLHDLLTRRPALARGRAYWAITPPSRLATSTAGGLAVGMPDDADYFPALLRPLLRRTLAVPASVGRTGPIGTCRYLTLLALLGAPDLAMVSVWSPSFLTLLVDALDESWERLLRDLEHGTVSLPLPRAVAVRLGRDLPAQPRVAQQLRARFGDHAPQDLGEVWEQLALISCWTEGNAWTALQGVRARFPGVEVQGKGLLATEGVVSIPLFDAPWPVLAVTSHYLELLDPRDLRAVPVHLAEVGATYEVALTTGGGLHRYRLRDLVRVEGFHHRTPMISFQGRADRASDLAGEKLTPALVERAIADALHDTGIAVAFAMLAPSPAPAPHYRLFVEGTPTEAAEVANALDRRLGDAHHYALCRALGQLGAIEGVAVRDGHRRYEGACADRGQRCGSIKPPALEATLDLDQVFDVPPLLVAK